LLSRFIFVLLVSVDTFANTRGPPPFPAIAKAPLHYAGRFL
jgi:hypothetical protein